jgi:hypothetical protein
MQFGETGQANGYRRCLAAFSDNFGNFDHGPLEPASLFQGHFTKLTEFCEMFNY